MDLHARTTAALDWAVVQDALVACTRTPRGSDRAARLSLLDDPGAIRDAFDAVDEVLALFADDRELPLHGMEPIDLALAGASRGEVLDLAVLRAVGSTLDALHRLATFTLADAEDRPSLAGLAAAIVVPLDVVDVFRTAFDPLGELSDVTWPILGELRRRISELHATVRQTLDALLRDTSLDDVLQEKFVTQRRDRYVIPVKAKARRSDLGIVHDVSGSGQTVFIEPVAVVELNNRLRIAEGELAAEERRIRAELSRMVGVSAPEISGSLDAAAALDLTSARAHLAERLDATRPQIGTDGVVRLHAARHPVLVLRGVRVVPNDLRIDATTPALVLSGPNAGGKTVSLKTIGLCALLVRAGCFVPASEGSRVDLFDPVMADVGDAQSIQGDLSSFSGHLVAMREMLAVAGPTSLVLLDELASGTDPAEGAALAQAIVEALLDAGARVVTTTHYARLKALGATDARFGAAAVEYAHDAPTYRVVTGAAGDSHALGAATRMGLPPSIVARAEALLGPEEATFRQAIAALESERAAAEDARRAAEAEAKALSEQRASLEARESELRRKAQELREAAAAPFLDRLKSADKAIAAVVAELQRAPSHKGVKAAKATVDALRSLVPEDKPPERPAADVAPGDRVRVIRVGQIGEVLSVAGDEVQVRAGTLTLRVRRTEIEPVSGSAPLGPQIPRRSGRRPGPDLSQAVRVAGNTVDLRGMRVDEAIAATERFMDRAVRDRQDVVFVLHGHGTGALKDAIREWLPTSGYVADTRPAGADQGGDAYTVAALRG